MSLCLLSVITVMATEQKPGAVCGLDVNQVYDGYFKAALLFPSGKRE